MLGWMFDRQALNSRIGSSRLSRRTHTALSTNTRNVPSTNDQVWTGRLVDVVWGGGGGGGKFRGAPSSYLTLTACSARRGRAALRAPYFAPRRTRPTPATWAAPPAIDMVSGDSLGRTVDAFGRSKRSNRYSLIAFAISLHQRNAANG